MGRWVRYGESGRCVSLGDFTLLQDIVIVCDREWSFVGLVTNE